MALSMEELTSDFLAQRRIAVAGVSRTDRNAPANVIYRKLRDSGYEVFALNPNADVVENDPCYSNLKALPRSVDAMVIATTPEAAEKLVCDCAAAGVSRVWMHRSFGGGSVSPRAVEYCRDHQMTVIAGGCPMMFCRPVDWGHRCMRWVLAVTGGMKQ
jgi:predicted CoA-binding protein